MLKCWVDLSFNSRIILNFFLFWNYKLQNRPKDLGLNGHLSNYLAFFSFKTRKVKDYPWVHPQDNSALGQINVTHVCTFLNRPYSSNSIIIFVWLIRKYLKYRFPWYKKWLEINHKLVPIESDIYILQFARLSVFFHFAHFWLWCTFCTKLVMSAEEPFV